MEEAGSFSMVKCLSSLLGETKLFLCDLSSPIQRRQTRSPWRGESVSLLHRDKANPFSMKRRERLASLQRGGQALLYEEERVSLLYIYI